MPYGLTDRQFEQIRGVLAQHPQLEGAVLFGSRAKGTFKQGSDIDLALIGDSLQFRDVLRLDHALDDLDLPYSFDLILYHQITDPDVRAHIDRVGVQFYYP